MKYTERDFTRLLTELNQIGVALSAEQDHDRLLEYIIVTAMQITAADGGTLYLKEEDTLRFAILYNNSLGEHQGGTSGRELNLYPIRLYDDDGNPNEQTVAACAVLHGKTINIPDAYLSDEFDFSGTRRIDEKRNYRSTSFLTVPMTNHENEVIGVLQLINATDPETGEVIPFQDIEQKMVESLASQAAVSITKQDLMAAQKNLFDAFIQLIANAIDEKSPYTAGHCRRVPVITRMLADAACEIDQGALREFSMTEEEKYELDVAAWLHDCGKITTPEFVVDKATKLETIFDRIQLVDERFSLRKQDCLIQGLLRKAGIDDIDALLREDPELRERLDRLDEQRELVRQCNVGGESLREGDEDELREIAGQSWSEEGGERRLLEQDELENLLIGRGTLNMRERQIINNHVSVTIKMLESLPYPKHLRRVPEYAGGHHEKMDGTGYPNGLRGPQMSLPARMLAIADVFEALTASDRPYKKSMSLSTSLDILKRMSEEGHIDPDLYEVFVRGKVYLKYAEKFLSPEQIDDIDESRLLPDS